MVHTGNCEPLSTLGRSERGFPVQDPNREFARRKFRLQARAVHLLPEARSLAKCHRVPRGAVEAWRSPTRKTAAYRGLCTCQSVWCCPVCSARISAWRASELTEAIATWRGMGGTVLLATATARHTRDDELADLLTRHRGAHARMWRQRAVRRALDEAGYVGRVTATEVTFGHGTGWHPHRHMLLFVRADADVERIRDQLAWAWTVACRREGLEAMIGPGLDIRGGEAAGAYVAKLGLEVALAVCKRGRGEDRYGVWELLASENQTLQRAFVTFARSMKGRHHLEWSKGLKRLLGVDEVTDEEVMQAQAEEDERLMATIGQKLWRVLCRAERRGDLLELLGLGDVAAAEDLIRSLGIDPADGIEWADTS